MADVTVKDINVQAVETPTYLWGINAVGRACKVVPWAYPVTSVVGLTGVINQADLRTALGLGNAAYLNTGTGAGTVAVGNHTHTPASLGAEPTIAAGTSAQYWRGDKVWSTLDKAAVGLNNVDNTSDADKPISSAASSALSGKEPTITAGTTGQYWRGDKTWATFPSIQVPIQYNEEGSQVAAAGSASIINFTGAGVDTSFAGNTLTVNVPNAGGGGWTAVDATDTVKGILKLTNDLGGTANLPVVAKINGVAISGTCASGNVITGDSASTASWKTLASAGIAPLANPSFTGNVSVSNINGTSPSGLANKIENGCMRIPSSAGASGSIGLGQTLYGAEGIRTFIGDWATFSGAVYQVGGVQDARTSSGAMHYVAFGTTTGAIGYILYTYRIKAQEALTLAGKPLTLSCRLTAGTTSASNHSFRIYKANAYDDFSGETFVASSGNLGAVSGTLDTGAQFTLSYADCFYGIVAQVLINYTGAPVSPAYLSIADFSCRSGSRVVPFEPRPLELEKALVNGAVTSGFRNKIKNGCCRISRKGPGAAALGWNNLGADGISTFIGGWSSVTGNIGTQASADSSVSSSGGTHLTNITAATGSAGYINHIVRIEAADALELAGKPITTSARFTPLTKQIDDVVIYIMKPNMINNFGAGTYVASAALGPVSANTTKDVSFSTTLTTADCANGLQIEIHCYYNSAVTAAFHCVIADLQCCAGSHRMPFELRPIAIEEQLRRRYYRKQAVWVGTSTARTVMPIDMFGTPTITGGGTGYVSTGTDKDTLVCYQTTAGLQTLVLNSELV